MCALKKIGSLNHPKKPMSWQQLNNNNVQSSVTTQCHKATVKFQATNVLVDLTWTPLCTHAQQFHSCQYTPLDIWSLLQLLSTSDGHLLKQLSLHYQFQIQRIWKKKSSHSSKEMHQQQERAPFQRKNIQRISLNHPKVSESHLMRRTASTVMVAVPSISSMILMMIRMTLRAKNSSH